MKKLLITLAAGLAGYGLACSQALAQTTIDQNKALAGNVTPGDTPGFPITISQPGSYKLTGNLTVPANVKGIHITANNVTLDLNGFTVSGPSTCTRDDQSRFVSCTHDNPQASGIDAYMATGTAVRNGTVKGFGGIGLAAGDHARIDNLRLTENKLGLSSIGLMSAGPIISNTVADTNAGYGMNMIVGVITNSRVFGNGGDGFVGSSGVTVSVSQALLNRGVGLKGVAVRGSYTHNNGVNRQNVSSMGGNLDSSVPF
ncbi:MAG: hypothetical protein QM788_14160 [Roseateles sp.]|uniref:hypothetical protein n=1 Tax=Roseateles sp. TaxID=1971397 RepID=UPI0039ED3C68